MTLSSSDRVLRGITIWAFIPAIAFLIPHGVISHNLCPALGLIPASFSLLFGVVQLMNVKTPRALNVIVDVFIALFLIGTLIAGWATMQSHRWYNGLSTVQLGTYGTVPLMVDFCIHAFFAFRDMRMAALINFMSGRMKTAVPCPHCQREFLYRWSLPESSTPSSKESYDRVETFDDDDDAAKAGPSMSKVTEPRPSTDDETARLV